MFLSWDYLLIYYTIIIYDNLLKCINKSNNWVEGIEKYNQRKMYNVKLSNWYKYV